MPIQAVQERLEKNTKIDNTPSALVNFNNSFRDVNVNNIKPFVPRPQVLVNANALLDVSASSSKHETSSRPLQASGFASDVDSSDQQYVVLPVVNVQAMDRQGNRLQLKTLLDTGSTSTFISVSASNKVMLVGESDEIHVDVNTLGGTNSVPTKEITFKLYHFNKHLRKKLIVKAFVTSHIVSSPACDEHPEPVVRNRLRKVKLNEGFPRPGSSIDLLLGIGDLFKVVRGVKERLTESFCVLDTIYGLVACGSHTPFTRLSHMLDL